MTGGGTCAKRKEVDVTPGGEPGFRRIPRKKAGQA